MEDLDQTFEIASILLVECLAVDLLRALKAAETPVLFVRAAGTAEAKVVTTTLGKADGALADMRTLVIVGASTTRQVGRWVYTPRREPGAQP